MGVFYNKKVPKLPLYNVAALFGKPPYEFPLIHPSTSPNPSPTSTHSSHTFSAHNPQKITLFQPISLPYPLHCQRTFLHTQAALVLSYMATKQKKETYVSPEHTDSQNPFTNKGFLYIFTFSGGNLYNNTWGARTPSSLCSYIGSLSLQTRLYDNLLYTPTYQSQQTALSLSTHYRLPQQTIFRPLRRIWDVLGLHFVPNA